MRTCEQILAPGMNLQIPEGFYVIKDMTPVIFLSKIGGGTNEYADKFETLKEIFEGNRVYM